MARKLPPLNTLRAFEAAARLASFSKAADELHVTHGAVSRAIKHLEDYLGLPVFTRATRTVQLTAAGASYAVTVRHTLDRLAAATAAIMEHPSIGVLNVSTLDSFAARWLVPRLFRFRRAYGDIDVRLETSERLADFANDGIDIAIRYGSGQYEGLAAEKLLAEDIFPVCSPTLITGRHPLVEPSDLKYHTLIHDDFPIDWPMWLTTAGVEGVDPYRGPRFLSSMLAIQSALQGDGVLLARSALIADELRVGRLVRPFELSLPTNTAYYVVYPPRALSRHKVRVFRDWLLSEVARRDELEPAPALLEGAK